MKNFAGLLSLPASLIAFTLCCGVEGSEKTWPHDPPRAAMDQEHEPQSKRRFEAQERLAWEAPTALKKMSDDAGEKFHLHYWQWNTLDQGSLGSFGAATEQYANTSVTTNLVPALVPHSNHQRRRLGIFGRNIFARDFECPSGTKSCSSIDSSLCCNTQDTCVNTSDGTGCCPSGETCGDNVAGCDTDAGYTSCPKGRGCCLPGAKCLDTGCVFYGTEIVTATSPKTTTAQSTSLSSPVSYTTTTTVTISGDGTTDTTTIVTTVTNSPSAGSSEKSTSTSTPTSTATAAPPIRPTTSGTSVSAADTQITTTTATSSSPAAGCPTGFYMCSAVYLGGCCRVDRNCDTTSCPASETTAVVTGSGVSIGVAGGATGGSCASGWMSCAASDGGGCCPAGYSCGASCIATVSGAGDTSKIAPESAAVVEKVLKVGFLGTAVLAGLGMVLL